MEYSIVSNKRVHTDDIPIKGMRAISNARDLSLMNCDKRGETSSREFKNANSSYVDLVIHPGHLWLH